MKIYNHRYRILLLLLFGAYLIPNTVYSQDASRADYRNTQTNRIITPFTISKPITKPHFTDLDNDGDPDILETTIESGIKILWIDDDDDMTRNDYEGDMDSDCLMMDLNGDGNYGGEKDLIIDYIDLDKDGSADMQAIVDNGKKDNKGKWESHFIWFLDDDNDGVFGYIDWDEFKFEGWDHGGRANFFTDYNGKSTMIKVHITTWNIDNLSFNWENPFLFFDPDNDGLSEMAIRVVDEPIDISNSELIKWKFSKNASLIQMTFDLDNDSAPSNELDYDMSLKFMGTGFDYSDQIHKIDLASLDAADTFFDDPRWRHLDHLVYPDHDTTYDLTFGRGNWAQCWMVFDEDDDSQRWERVEFYDPKDPFRIGTKNGGLDHNPQADAAGDRAEWDLDFSGKGQLYISPIDGRIHLLGAEIGYWRIDQNATYFQGWQGWRGPNLQPEDFDKSEPILFGTVKYEDTDNNGFMDEISMDLDGDFDFEQTINIKELGIDDKAKIYHTADMQYEDYHELYKFVSQEMWNNATNALIVAQKFSINTASYAQLMNPKTLREDYDYGYWLSFYIYHDLLFYADHHQDTALKNEIIKAYYSSNWKTLLK